MTSSNSANYGDASAAATDLGRQMGEPRSIIALVSEQSGLTGTLSAALTDFEIVNQVDLERVGLSWTDISAMVVDLDTYGITNQLTLMNQVASEGFTGETYAVGANADPELDRHLKLLNQQGLFVHDDETDMAILNVTLKRDLQKQQRSRHGAKAKRTGIAGTAREIAGLIKAWNTRLSHEQEPGEPQR